MDLDREGFLRVHREIAPDDPLWEDVEVELGGPVSVDLELTATATGQVLARGTIGTSIRGRCRRCLDEVTHDLEQEVSLVWVPRDDFPEEEAEHPLEEGELRVLDLTENELDLGAALREEVILAAPRYLLCREDCRGLCPRCGINRNEETCDCTLDEPDPRWDALRALKNE